MNDEKTIQAIQSGDEQAIDNVITKYSKLLWSIASAVLKNAASAQDIEECVADVFIYLWQHPEKYDAGRGRLKVWLSILARTRAVDRYRTLSKEHALPLDEALLAGQIDAIDGILAENQKCVLQDALSALEALDHEILLRRYYYDQKPREIALALDMPVKHVENHLYRTKRKLRQMITSREKEAL